MMMRYEAFSARIILIDDHPAVRQGLSILLASRQHQVVGEAEGIADALALVNEKECDIALLDLTLKDGSGLELLSELKAHKISVLVYTMHDDPRTISRAFSQGALGYVTKQEDPDILFKAIDTLMSGKRFMSPYLANILQQTSPKDQFPEDSLSDRERQLFNLMEKGIGNTEIAERMHISPRTVETYFTRITKKLEFKSRRELRKYAASIVQ